MWIYRNTELTAGKQITKIGAGVIQGGVTSPTLFIIVFNELLAKIKEMGLEQFAYADDLAVTGNGKNKLKRVIKVIENWADTAKMIINKDPKGNKSAIMYLRRNRRSKMEQMIFQDNE